MIELPESYSLSAQLTKTLKGKEITAVTAAFSPHGFAFYNAEPSEYDSFLRGAVIEKACPVAGQVEIVMGERRLLFNDGINMRYLEAGSPVPKKHQLLVAFADGSCLVCTVAMYGGMNIFKDGEYDNGYYLVAKEKPSPLTPEFDENYYRTLFQDITDTMTVKAFLATKQRIPGLGNGVLQDILFRAGIHPKTRIAALKEAERSALYRSVKNTLAEMAEHGGRDTEKDLFGNPGGYHTLLSSKTLKFPCPSCGSTLVREAFLGGNIYYCPFCQPKIT